MARKKPDYEGLRVQEFLSKAQAMAYVNYADEEKFNEDFRPYCHVYRNGDSRSRGDYYLPELRKRKLQLVEIEPQIQL